MCHWCVLNVWRYNRIGHNNGIWSNRNASGLQEMVVEDDPVVMGGDDGCCGKSDGSSGGECMSSSGMSSLGRGGE